MSDIKDPELLAAINLITEEAAKRKRLEGAAPAMLEALEKAAPWLGKLIAEGAHQNSVLPNDAIRTLVMVEAAIAQAKGE